MDKSLSTSTSTSTHSAATKATDPNHSTCFPHGLVITHALH